MVNCDQFFNFICWDLKLTFLSYLTLGCSRIYQDSVDTSFITNDDEVGTRELSKRWIFRSLKGRAIMWLPLWLVYNIKFKKFQCLFWNTMKILLFFLSNFYDAYNISLQNKLWLGLNVATNKINFLSFCSYQIAKFIFL